MGVLSKNMKSFLKSQVLRYLLAEHLGFKTIYPLLILDSPS